MYINICREGAKRTEPGSSQWCRDRIRGNEHKLKHGRFHWKIRNQFFTVRVPEPWHRLPREVMESPTLEIFKSCLDTVLGNQLCSLSRGAWTR